MSKTFHLDIVTPTEVITIGQIEYLRAPGIEGLFGIKAKHAPATVAMNVGEIKITKDNQNLYYATNGGFADINSEGVLLLVETIEPAEKIDKKRATEAIERAKKYLNNNNNDIKRAQKSLARAKNRLKIAEKI